MLNYYIYYRVDLDSAHTLEPMVRSMQARLKCSSGVMGRLLKKRGEENLWMEIYENVAEPEKFERALAQAVEKNEIEMFLAPDGKRHMECFSGD